ncbi:hypothetical protein EG68_11644 [Paragonimus skrjabini miyazakii]|uniref:fumarate hydratase n=1 Tax=Paragonimus skrjabini miyazakii TaxID=59628 RepID=A0A8S9YHE2_9TREM|nr:hypothetical protein EG68_11644 [Paragonimus skrjabini miyazakii]
MSDCDRQPRVVEDSFGKIELPADCHYGAQTERSRRNFPICMDTDRMPLPVIYALAMLKEVAAGINAKYKRIDELQAEAIITACRDVYLGKLDKEFPLSTWQTGSGTQTNMNVNEVISHKANEILCGKGNQQRVHPNDHVNCGQSTNDIFPTAMHVCVALETAWKVLPSLEKLTEALLDKVVEFKNIIKIGRTHLQDAVPMTVGQELSAFTSQLNQSISFIKRQLSSVCELAIGGTAVGTGLNSFEGFDQEMSAGITRLVKKASHSYSFRGDQTGSLIDLNFVPAENKFAALSGHDGLLQLSSAFNATATVLFKLANDFALLSSGPSCGLGELLLPPNEPGSSIMPGKVNPTQCEALSMVAVQVMGNHFTVTLAASHGQLQLNVYKPIIIANMLHSCRLISDAVRCFADNCVSGLQVNSAQIGRYVRQSLMLVTALSPHIGYDQAACLAKYAQEHGLTLRDAAIQLQMMNPEEFDRLVQPKVMAFPFGDSSVV